MGYTESFDSFKYRVREKMDLGGLVNGHKRRGGQSSYGQNVTVFFEWRKSMTEFYLVNNVNGQQWLAREFFGIVRTAF